MSGAAGAMPVRAFLTQTTRVACDLAIVLFCALIALPMTFGLSLVSSPMPVFLAPGVLMLVFATSALMKYATLVSRALALGNVVPSAESAVFDYLRSLWAFAPWLALVMLNGIGIATWHYLGNTGLVAFLVLALPLVPAAIAVISVNRSPLSVFRIPSLLHVVRVLGSDYLKILIGWALIGLFGEWLRTHGALGMSYLAVLTGCLQIMYLFTSTGVVLFHHHRALEIPIERDTREARDAAYLQAGILKERRNALNQAYVFFSRGNNVGGLARLQQHFAEHGDDDDTWRWFLGEMRGWENRQPLLLLARNYLTRLLRAEDKSEAFRLMVECIETDPGFAPHPEDRAAARALMSERGYADAAARWR